jgi:hypothetical protein
MVAMVAMVLMGHTPIALLQATPLLFLLIPMWQLDIMQPFLSIAEQHSEALTTSTMTPLRYLDNS